MSKRFSARLACAVGLLAATAPAASAAMITLQDEGEGLQQRRRVV